jgi:hypothetical protein
LWSCPLGVRTRLNDASRTAPGGGTIERHDDFHHSMKEKKMFIAVLDLYTTAADRAAALAQLDAERQEIRAMPGNLDFRGVRGTRQRGGRRGDP